MFNVKISYNDIFIASIEKEDFDSVETWMKQQEVTNKESACINISELKDRFVEYYITDSEIFLKLIKRDCIIGVFKGRIEDGKLIIWCYIIEDDMRRNGIGSAVLEVIMNYFRSKYGIIHFITGVVEGNTGSIKFWYKNQFDKYRVSKNFFSNGDKKKDMLLLKRNLENSF